MRTRRLLATLVIGCTAVAAGCSGGGSKKANVSGPSAADAGSAGVAAATGAAAVSGKAAAANATAPAAPPGLPADSTRRVILTAELRVRVHDAGAALARAGTIAEQADGFVAAQELGRTHRAEAHVTVKVAPARFRAVQEALGGLGTVLDRSSNTNDVTDEVVDIDGRLKTAQASADRLRALMGRSGSAPEIAQVEGELARREADIESLQGRQRVLANVVDLATVTEAAVAVATVRACCSPPSSPPAAVTSPSSSPSATRRWRWRSPPPVASSPPPCWRCPARPGTTSAAR